MHYRDFVITIYPKSGTEYSVSVDSPAGNSTSILHLDYDQLGKLWLNISKAVRGRAMRSTFASIETSAQQIGEQLYAQLFVGNVNTLWNQSLGQIHANSDVGLRVKLKIPSDTPETAKLMALPWEFLYEKENRQFLNLSRRTPIVRYLEVHRPIQLPPFEPPLRILVVISRAAPAGAMPLSLNKERDQIERAWAKHERIDVHFLPQATTESLRNALLEHNFHVLHFMGHGDFDPQTGSGVLLFEDDYGDPNPVRGQVLAVNLLDRIPPLRLAFLNACQTAALSEIPSQDPFAGVATSLVMGGLPAVIAMQFPISDEAALAFAGTFYARLASNDPVDAATAESRLAIFNSQDGNPEWGTPVLFMRTEDGYLFTQEMTSHESADERPPVLDFGVGLITTTLSQEAQESLKLCFDWNRDHILKVLPESDHRLAMAQLRTLYEAFLVEPINISKIQSALNTFESSLPHALEQARQLLQEPTLQKLARKSDKQQEYEHLAFDF